MSKLPPYCETCFKQDRPSSLIRLAWELDSLVVAKVADDITDLFICEDCIRLIKRLRFQDIARSIPAPEFIEVPDEE